MLPQRMRASGEWLGAAADSFLPLPVSRPCKTKASAIPAERTAANGPHHSEARRLKA